jgi:hypothetical protein
VDIYKDRPFSPDYKFLSPPVSFLLFKNGGEIKIRDCRFFLFQKINPTLRRFLPLIHPDNMINIIASKKSVENPSDWRIREADGIESLIPSAFFFILSAPLSRPNITEKKSNLNDFEQDFLLLLERCFIELSLN